jgi:hypothetical protein
VRRTTRSTSRPQTDRTTESMIGRGVVAIAQASRSTTEEAAEIDAVARDLAQLTVDEHVMSASRPSVNLMPIFLFPYE